MKKQTALLCLFLLILPVSSISLVTANPSVHQTELESPGQITGLSCSNPYPTLGEPVYLVITIQGNANERFDEPVVVTDQFSGFVKRDNDMEWISGDCTEIQQTITVGKQSMYTKKIPWYPSVVGNHTLHVTAGSFPERLLNVSVSFDVEGIIAPSLGCPALLLKNRNDSLQVTMSEERTLTDDPAQILNAEVHDVHDATTYPLGNQTMRFQTWIATGSTTREDDLVVSFDIGSIPEGFYNLSVTTAKTKYTWPHAVRIRQTDPTEYTIVHLSDIHIGKFLNFNQKTQELIRLFTSIDENIHPDFVVITGDSVDWYNQWSHQNAYAFLQKAFLSCPVPVFTTPGNHERYENRLVFLYYPFKNLTGYHRFLNPLNDYSQTYGDVNFVFLDSGYEYSRWEIQPKIWNPTPEGSGLTSTQMYLLQTVWGQGQLNQIISMHHLAVNDKNDTGLGALPNDLPSGNDECIAFNRGAFITYCSTDNVSLVLTGHSHENHVFTELGQETQNPFAWPLFVQTASATMNGPNDGGRIISFKNSTVVSYEFQSFL